MAKKEKVVDLKPTSISEKQLKAIQEIVSPINNMQREVGRIEVRKHMILHDVVELQEKLQEQQNALEKEYGKVNINIQNGEINYDVEADS
tara:strand:- start:637 stop:906 length:270 start_codon:yes stop_codon:yes gene_type:complete